MIQRNQYKQRTLKSATILHWSDRRERSKTEPQIFRSMSAEEKLGEKPKKFCPFCNTTQHYLNQCVDFQTLTREQVESWIRSNQRCWRCGREHTSAKCNLKAKCKKCDKRHLMDLQEVNSRRDSANKTVPVQSLQLKHSMWTDPSAVVKSCLKCAELSYKVVLTLLTLKLPLMMAQIAPYCYKMPQINLDNTGSQKTLPSIL